MTTSVLLHFSGPDNSTTFTDESGKAWTPQGGAKIIDVALYCDGIDSYIDTPDHADFNVGAGDWTIDFFIKFDSQSYASTCGVFQHGIRLSTDGTFINCTAGAVGSDIELLFSFGYGVGASEDGEKGTFFNIPSTPGIWYHIAVVRNGARIYPYLHGVQQTSVNFTGLTCFNPSDNFRIGAEHIYIEDPPKVFHGSIDDFRFTKGSALWTSNFTPPARTQYSTIEAESLLEVYNNGAWVALTPDLKFSPSPRWNKGIMTNRQDERVGYPGILEFTLNNAANNAAGLAGYYSPGHTNCPAWWTSGLPVRLSFGYGTTMYTKYYGWIKADGIQVIPNVHGSQEVAITCGDWMWRAGIHELKSISPLSSKKIGDLVSLVNANMVNDPTSTDPVVLAGFGEETFPTIFDLINPQSTALSEYVKAALSEWGYVYDKGNTSGGHTLVVEDQNIRPAATLKQITVNGVAVDASFDNTMVPPMQVAYGRTLINRVSSRVYPRIVETGANTVLWSLDKSFQIGPLETVTGVRADYTDPNTAKKISAVNVTLTGVVADSDEGGGGTPMTGDLSVVTVIGSDAVTMDLTNNNVGTALWVTEGTVLGDMVTTYDPIPVSQDDAGSQSLFGVMPITLDLKYLVDARKAEKIGTYLLTLESEPRSSVEEMPLMAFCGNEFLTKAFLEIEPGDLIHVEETQAAINDDYFVNGYDAELINGKIVKWSPKLKNEGGIWITDPPITQTKPVFVSAESGSLQYSYDHTTTAETDDILLIWVYAEQEDLGVPITGVTVDGDAAVLVDKAEFQVFEGAARIYLFYYLNPSAGANTIIAIGANLRTSGVSVHFSNVDTANPITAISKASGLTGTTCGKTLNLSQYQYGIGSAGVELNSTPPTETGTGHTSRGTHGTIYYSGRTGDNANTAGVLTWSFAAADWCYLVAALNGA